MQTTTIRRSIAIMLFFWGICLELAFYFTLRHFISGSEFRERNIALGFLIFAQVALIVFFGLVPIRLWVSYNPIIGRLVSLSIVIVVNTILLAVAVRLFRNTYGFASLFLFASSYPLYLLVGKLVSRHLDPQQKGDLNSA